MKWNRIGIGKRLIISGKYRKAKKMLRPIAENGNADAQYMLGYLYYGGDSETNSKDAKYWLTKAAKQGHPDALAEIAATDFKFGGWSTTPETPRGIKQLEKAAKKGSADAQRNLACTYAVGEAVNTDLEKAAYWYTKAAKQGHAEAQNDIAGMWLDGEAGSIDLEQAIYWYKKCAALDKNVPYAQWAAEALSNIYGGKFYDSHNDKSKEKHWKSRAKYLSKIKFRAYPDWFYE
ncbi:MAG: tetratricopeptide repeat protein [Candidatus Thiodiazotropha sp. DIVDIV]